MSWQPPGGWLMRQVAVLYPGAFALVMATGIISNALFFEGYRALSDALFAVGALAYPLLLAATLLRGLRYPSALIADLLSPRFVFGFFTIVAGTGVLGAGLLLRGYGSLAMAMWACALVLWLGLTYLSFGVLTFLKTGHGANIVHGGWLNAIVGTQSLVVLGALVAPALGSLALATFVLIHMLWGIGLGLYGIFIVLFAHRIFFLAFEPDDITPLLWVVMGAAAISTNAGSLLIGADGGLPFLRSMKPFVDGVTLLMWAWATWWIPLLLLFGLWKHVIRQVPLRYTPMLWSMVFPLGMYALASLRLSLAAEFAPLAMIARLIIFVALAAWAATMAAFFVASWRDYRAHGSAFPVV
jgi:tellurite resistance protein TehA-like permease